MPPRKEQSEYIRRKIGNESWDNLIGFVTKVHEHDGEEQRFSNHEVNVQLVHRQEEFKRVPVHTDHKGSIYVPETGDAVELAFLQSKTQRPVVENVVYTDEVRAPLARSGQFRREFRRESDKDPLYFEAERKDHKAGKAELIRIAKKVDGLSDPEIAIELDDSGNDPIATIRRNSDPDKDGNDELEMTLDAGEKTATIKGDPNDDDQQKLVAGVDNNAQKAFLEVTTTGGDTIEMKINQTDGTIDILTKGQEVRVGDKDGTFEPVARKGDAVEVSDPDSGTLSGEITAGSSNVKST